MSIDSIAEYPGTRGFDELLEFWLSQGIPGIRHFRK
jgi:hypothetical protein